MCVTVHEGWEREDLKGKKTHPSKTGKCKCVATGKCCCGLEAVNLLTLHLCDRGNVWLKHRQRPNPGVNMFYLESQVTSGFIRKLEISVNKLGRFSTHRTS